MPKRIQRRRVHGWRMPENCMVVSRPSKWGNPFVTTDPLMPPGLTQRAKQQAVVDEYHRWLRYTPAGREVYVQAGTELRGKDLACWCPLCEKHADGKPLDEQCPDCQPCHADVLLEIANA
ncbi:MAG: DUF4326 domain-containing protein [Candidatus Omnitrophota bacterium]|nr:DUF4326 domain-containing protein [Candidatus Omnitrophota bacterium]